MAAFRILNQFPVYLGNTGLPLDGGKLRFYQAGTADPKDVYGDPGLSINNGPEVDLNSAGRTAVDVWGDGEYKVRLYDAADQLIDEADNVEIPGGDALSIPSLVTGYFLTNNGALLLWAPVREVPDPTGQSGKVLGTDGTALLWQALAAVAANAIVTFPMGGIKISDGTTAYMVQFGSDTVPASGTTVGSKAFSFGTAYPAAPRVFASITGGPGIGNPGGGIPAFGVNGIGSTGATMGIDMNGYNSIINPVPFSWIAIGAVAP